ncbi:MAG: proline--tRNA ligase [Alphaproteobacteria bacterium]|nr:proline--tRNA ligase [Alphaproteobacteria bacterium]
MRLSEFFLPTLKENPAEAQIISHRLMLRAGMIKQSGQGLYSWLPLGLRVLNKIANIIREEQNRAGAHELLMATIQQAELWQESGRYEDYGKEMLRITDRHDRPLLYGPTAEEVITAIIRDSVKSYKHLPQNLFQIHWKFRDEIRPRFGVMRGREFLMKDGYSFDHAVDLGKKVYQKMFVSYLRTFARLGLTAIPMQADTGPIGGDSSHEFIILAETGESQVFCDSKIRDLNPLDSGIDYAKDLSPVIKSWTDVFAATEEKFDAAAFAALPPDRQLSARGIEVGHIFFFGDKYSKPMKAIVQDPSGNWVPLQSGSYGIGVSRLVGGMIEASHDDKGIIWHPSVSPFDVVVINLKSGDPTSDNASEKLAAELLAAGLEVMVDDRDLRAGEKFAEHDLLGISFQFIVGPKSLAEGKVELKDRKTGVRQDLPLPQAVESLLQARRSYLR